MAEYFFITPGDIKNNSEYNKTTLDSLWSKY